MCCINANQFPNKVWVHGMDRITIDYRALLKDIQNLGLVLKLDLPIKNENSFIKVVSYFSKS